MFINFTNHTVSIWSDKQREEAEQYGEIAEIHFPNVSPYDSADDIKLLADNYVSKIVPLLPDNEENAVLCQGEFSLCVAVIEKLKSRNIKVLCACSERLVIEEFDGEKNIKKSEFHFVGFREM